MHTSEWVYTPRLVRKRCGRSLWPSSRMQPHQRWEADMTTALRERIHGRSLVSETLFNRLVGQIVEDDPTNRDQAERIMDQALAFLRACAECPDRPLRPSRAVDIGWHTFILNTHAYAEFCQRIAGRFIHHEPDEFTPPEHPTVTLAPTVNTMRLLGLAVHDDLWMQGSGDCSQCHSGCTNCGQGDGSRRG